VDVDGVRPEGVGLVVPDVLGDRAAVRDARGAAHEDLQDAELGTGEGGVPTAGGHLPSRRVELEFPDDHPRRLADRRPALQGPEPGEELTEVERLDQVVVGPRVQAGDPVRGGVPGRQHEHRRRSTAAAQLANQVQAGHPGHAPVEHGHLVLVEPQVRGRGLAVGHQIHHVALLPEPAGQHLGQALVVLGDKHPHSWRIYPDGRLVLRA
jgi:hypothetical protein